MQLEQQQHAVAPQLIGDMLNMPKVPRPKPMIICDECGELLQRSSLGRHRQRRHGAPTASIRDILPLKNANLPHVPRTNQKPRKRKNPAYLQSASTSSSLNGSEYGDDDDLSQHSLMTMNEFSTLNSSMLNAPSINRTLLQESHSCQQCERSFAWKTNLRRHEKHVHGMIGDRAFVKKVARGVSAEYDAKPYQCDYCDCSFSDRANLCRHRSEKHGVNGFTPCRRHVRKEYNGQIPIEEPLPLNDDDALPWLRRYECMECGLAYATSEELDIHDMARHEHRRVQTSYVCAYCPATFPNQDKCSAHEQKHGTQARYSCQSSPTTCSAKFFVPMMKEFHESVAHLDGALDEDDEGYDDDDSDEDLDVTDF